MTSVQKDRMQQAIARMLRDLLQMPNTEEAGWQAMEMAAAIMDFLKKNNCFIKQ